MSTTVVPCPTCQKEVPWSEASQWKPFCSERCRLIDLGAWADEQYSIPANEPPGFNNADAPSDTLN